MTPEEILKLQKRARYVATKWGQGEIAEDFAQEFILTHEKWPRQRIAHAFIDYLRRSSGRKGTCGYHSVSTEAARTIYLDAPVNSEAGDSALHHELIGSPGADPRDQLEFIELAESLKSTDRAIFWLTYVWGFNQDEIGHCFGITACRVSQRLSEVQSRISKALAREEQRTSEKVGPKIPHAPAATRSRVSCAREQKMESLLLTKDEGGPHMELFSAFQMEKAEPREMALPYEACVQAWLTQEVV